MINNRDLAGTQDLLNTINGLMSSLGGGTGLDYESLSSTIATKARDGIKDLNAQLGNAFLFKNEAAYLPSLYEIMANKVLYKDEVDADNLTPSEVYDICKGISSIDSSIAGQNIASDLTSFTEVVNTRYAINDTNKLVAPTTSEDPTIVTQMQAFGTNYDNAIQGSVLASGWNAVLATIEANPELDTDEEVLAAKASAMYDGFNPYATESEAAAIFADAFTVNASGVSNVTLNRVIVEDA